MIENLTDKLLKKIISDENYKINLKRFELKRESLKQERQKYDERKNNWLEEVEQTFNLAKAAREKFNNGNRITKRKLLMQICSNFLLKDQKLLIEAKKPFIKIKEGKTRERPLIRKFELTNKGLDKVKKPMLNRLIPIWSGRAGSNRLLQLGRLA